MIVAHSVDPYLFATGSWIYNQIKCSDRCRHIVLTTKRQNMDQFPYAPVYSIEDLGKVRSFFEKGCRRLYPRYLPYWYKTCLIEKVDILHSHFGWAGVSDMPIAKKLDIPHIVSFYGADMARTIHYRARLLSKYRKMFDSVVGVFVEGAYAKNTLVNMGCSGEKVYISHLGVDLNAIKSIKRTWSEGTPFRVLVVGTFTQKKGIMISLQAIEKVMKSSKIKMEVSIVGDARQRADELKVKAEILAFVNLTSLKKVTKFYGYLPYQQVLSMSYEHHLLMQTSIHAEDGDCEGGFPVIITDMMATGMPVIGSDHCDIPEIVKHGKNGLVARQGDIDSTVEQIIMLLKNYNDYQDMFIAFNQNFLRNNFEARRCALNREGIYQKITA